VEWELEDRWGHAHPRLIRWYGFDSNEAAKAAASCLSSDEVKGGVGIEAPDLGVEEGPPPRPKAPNLLLYRMSPRGRLGSWLKADNSRLCCLKDIEWNLIPSINGYKEARAKDAKEAGLPLPCVNHLSFAKEQPIPTFPQIYLFHVVPPMLRKGGEDGLKVLGEW